MLLHEFSLLRSVQLFLLDEGFWKSICSVCNVSAAPAAALHKS